MDNRATPKDSRCNALEQGTCVVPTAVSLHSSVRRLTSPWSTLMKRESQAGNRTFYLSMRAAGLHARGGVPELR